MGDNETESVWMRACVAQTKRGKERTGEEF
jgi:hypothetical protein